MTWIVRDRFTNSGMFQICEATGSDVTLAAVKRLDVATLMAAAPELLAAAVAVVERWDTPTWKDAPATGAFINGLRKAIAKATGENNADQP
jgi:hypothetical protein